MPKKVIKLGLKYSRLFELDFFVNLSLFKAYFGVNA